MTKNLKFYSSTDLEFALELLAEDENIEVIAGGTDLMVDIRQQEDHLEGCTGILGLTDIKEMKGIEKKGDYIEIGALTTHDELLNSDLLQDYYPALVEAAAAIGSPQVRNRGTIGGNICNAAACADTFGPLVAFEANVVLESTTGIRVMPAQEFVELPYQTKLRSDELLTRFRLPLPGENMYSNFQKIGRRQAMAITRVSLAVAARIEDEVVRYIKVVPGSATPVPQPFGRAESEIRGEIISDLNPDKLGEIAAAEMVEITGERWSTPYKKPALKTLVSRAVRGLQKEAEVNE